jgi:hypothetical protein
VPRLFLVFLSSRWLAGIRDPDQREGRMKTKKRGTISRPPSSDSLTVGLAHLKRMDVREPFWGTSNLMVSLGLREVESLSKLAYQNSNIHFLCLDISCVEIW